MVKVREVERRATPMPGGDEPISLWAWLLEEARDHLFPWGPGFTAQKTAIQAAGIALAVVVTLVWILAAAGRMASVIVIAWWVGWSVYEVLCRRRCKPWVKDGPWWGRKRRPADTVDLIFYVATKNLLIGAGLFLLLMLLNVSA
jgi:NosR/NirI family nitrous oxide reductase transcriptional regulator